MNEAIAYLGLLDEEELQLDAAALELAVLDHVGIDLAPYAAQLSDMTVRLTELGGDSRTSSEQARILSRVIAAEHGFTGDRDSYDDPANADMIRVIDRRLGLPVSLSILYVAAARRLGWSADALNTPGHVLVRIGPEISPVIIDPFNDGRRVEAEQLESLVATMAGGSAPVAARHVAAMPNRAVLTRLLLNQATRAEDRGDVDRARILYERINTFAPGDANAWWQRARLALTAGGVEEARASLTALLEVTRDPRLRMRVGTTLAQLG